MYEKHKPERIYNLLLQQNFEYSSGTNAHKTRPSTTTRIIFYWRAFLITVPKYIKIPDKSWYIRDDEQSCILSNKNRRMQKCFSD